MSTNMILITGKYSGSVFAINKQ